MFPRIKKASTLSKENCQILRRVSVSSCFLQLNNLNKKLPGLGVFDNSSLDGRLKEFRLLDAGTIVPGSLVVKPVFYSHCYAGNQI